MSMRKRKRKRKRNSYININQNISLCISSHEITIEIKIVQNVNKNYLLRKDYKQSVILLSTKIYFLSVPTVNLTVFFFTFLSTLSLQNIFHLSVILSINLPNHSKQ